MGTDLLPSLAVAAALAAGAQGPSLSDAVLYGQTDAVREAIAKGADVNQPDTTGMTPLMIAAEQGRTGIAEMLIAAGASVRASAGDGTTALMHAASANRLETLRLLLDRGADPNARTKGGDT